MSEERMKILDMLSQGIITASEANELLKNLDEKKIEVNGKTMTEGQYLKSAAAKFLYIEAKSHDGDNVNVTIPLSLIKAAVKMGNIQGIIDKSLSWSSFANEAIDIDLILQCIESGTTGNIVSMDSKEGDSVRIYIE
ncbi:MAG: hypothetical protein QM208_04480 [Bacillota bacterium]|nr:hypothetical protein [Bacillota bacterium]